MLLTGGTLAQLIFWTIFTRLARAQRRYYYSDAIMLLLLLLSAAARFAFFFFPCALQFAFKHPPSSRLAPLQPHGSGHRARACACSGAQPRMGISKKKPPCAKVLAEKASTAPKLPERQQESSPGGQGGDPRHWFGLGFCGFFLAKSNPPWHLGHGHQQGKGERG